MLLFLDIESTGIHPETDSILEISAARFDGKRIIETFDSLIRIPDEIEIPKNISLLTGITKEMLEREGILLEEAKKNLEAFFRPDDVITGHNISFDTAFLRQNGIQIPEKELDTFILSTIVLEQEESCSLEILTEKYGLTHENAHRAMSDVLANIELWKLLQRECLRQMNPRLKEKLRILLSRADFSEGVFFEEILQMTNAQDSSISSPLVVSQDVLTESDFFLPNTTLDIEQVFSSSQKAILNTPQPQKTLFSILSDKSKKAILFPRQSFRRFFALFQKTKNTFPDKKSVFCSAPNFRIDQEAFGQFLARTSFPRLESIVGLKILFAVESDIAPDFSFSGDEWTIADALLLKPSAFSPSFFEENDFFFAPLSDLSLIPEEIPVVFFGANNLEDHLTEILEKKVYSRRLTETILRCPTSSSWTEETLLLMEKISSFLREELGESLYPLSLPINDALLRKNEFLLITKEIQRLFGEERQKDFPQECKTLCEEWGAFAKGFREENTLFFFQLFPSGEFSLALVPIMLSSAVEKLCKRSSTVLFVGQAFPRNEEGRVQFSFSFPSEVKEYQYLPPPSVFFEETIFLPKGNGDLSPKEIFPFLEALLHGESGNILFSVNSQKIAASFEDLLLDLCEYRGIKLLSHRSGSAGKIRSLLKRSGRKVVIATPKLLDDIHTEDFEFSVMLILKFSFDPKGNPLLEARKRYFRNEFVEYAVPRAKARFEKELFRAVRSDHPLFTIVFDTRIADDQGFGKGFRSVLPQGVEIKRISPDDIRTLFPSVQERTNEEPREKKTSLPQQKAEQKSLF
jgi:DNA polymerase III epsilon subunit-like protein